MGIVKSYTSLEQSKILAEIIPAESADYFWSTDINIVVTEPYITKTDYENLIPACEAVPCWSLAALLNILPKIHGLKPIIDLEENSIQYNGIDLYIVSENLIDTCVQMILKLNELDLL